MGESRFQFGLFGYSKKDVDLQFDSMREEFFKEKENLISEKEELQKTIRELRRKEAELEKRNEEFNEVERSVSSIMSVTQRASDKLYEDATLQRQKIADIASNTAQEIAKLRQDIINVRQNMNGVLGELQNRLDIIDKTLTGTVSNLISVKNEVLNNSVSSAADIQNEVDQLLKLASKDIDILPVSKYKVPDLGQYSSSLITSSAAKVMNSRMNAYNGVASDATADDMINEIDSIAKAVENTDPTPLINSTPTRFESISSDKDEDEDETKAEVIEMPESTQYEDEPDPVTVPEERHEPQVVTASTSTLSDPDWFVNSPLTSSKSKKVSVTPVLGAAKIKVKPVAHKSKR